MHINRVQFQRGLPMAEFMQRYGTEAQDYPWIIGFSGGKDSTVVAQAVFEALLQVPPSKRKRHVHVVSNDTQVESPLVMAHLAKVQTALREMAESLRLPVTVVTTRPAADKTFWTLLIGKGYPSPNQTMRQSSQVKTPNSSALFLSHVFVGFWSGRSEEHTSELQW